jgi:hypothetical protein
MAITTPMGHKKIVPNRSDQFSQSEAEDLISPNLPPRNIKEVDLGFQDPSGRFGFVPSRISTRVLGSLSI